MIRSSKEWRAHEQGVALAAKPRVELVKIGDAAGRATCAGDAPASQTT